MTTRDRILYRRARLVAAALATTAIACGSTEPQACLSPKCVPPECGPMDSGSDAVKDVMDEPQVCLSMPPPDAGDGGDSGDAQADG